MAKAGTSIRPVESLSEAEAAAELARLAAEIATHDRRYYQDDRPISNSKSSGRISYRLSDLAAARWNFGRDRLDGRLA